MKTKSIQDELTLLTEGEYIHEIMCYDCSDFENFVGEIGYCLIVDGFSRDEILEFFTTIRVVFVGDEEGGEVEIKNIDVKKLVNSLFEKNSIKK